MDAVDRHILKTLQERARTTNVELARANDLAPSSMLDRVRRLEDKGIIRGYRAELDPKELGYQVAAMVMINLAHHQTTGIGSFEEDVANIPEVKACFHVTGRYDYILHLAARDIDHLSELVKHRIGALGGVEKQETFLVLSTVKEDQGYSLEPLNTEECS
jgi:Lrp/AsnC family leucine-responsive transcriptional regulator